MKSIVYVISENNETIEKVKSTVGTDENCTLTVLTPSQWVHLLDKPEDLKIHNLSAPTLISGAVKSDSLGAKVLNFKNSVSPTQVESIDKLEARAIEAAISQFKGNLTEAAKALGIGRATLYRKVKHYQIDPAMARRKKVA